MIYLGMCVWKRGATLQRMFVCFRSLLYCVFGVCVCVCVFGVCYCIINISMCMERELLC